MMKLKTLPMVAFAVLVVTVGLCAQQTNVGNITGIVEDPSGAVVPAAEVTAVNSGTNVTYPTLTTSGGVYFINLLPVGTYAVTVTKSGFEKETRTDVRVIAGQTFTVNVVLRVGATTQTITVTGAPPLLNTTDTTQGTSRTLQELEDLPINLQGNAARAAINAVQTLSGINYNTMQSGGQSWAVISRSIINGVEGAFNYEIDGVEAASGTAETTDYITPVPDQIAEVRITENTDATKGFNAGSTIAMVTKSGTNDLHGSVFYYVRNDAMEARNWFLPKVFEDKQNEGGLTLGGPVYIPHLYNGKNKTFFFGAIDMYRYVTTSTESERPTVVTVPTSLMRSGNFTELLGSQIGTDELGRPIYSGEIYDPTTTRQMPDGSYIRDPYDYNGVLNTINPAQASSISSFFTNHVALPNLTGTVNNWSGPAAKTLVGKNQWSLKVDQAIGEKHRLTFMTERQFAAPMPAVSSGSGHFYLSGAPGWQDDITEQGFINLRNQYRYRLNYVWTAKPDLVINFNTGVTRDPDWNQSATPTSGPGTTAARTAGLTGTLNPRTPTMCVENNVCNMGPVSGQEMTVATAERLPVTLQAVWMKAKHQFIFGADYVAAPFASTIDSDAAGSFSFSHLETSLPGTLTNQTGAGIASWYTGWVDSASVPSVINTHWLNSAAALYAQDKWRATKKLTINYGLRWELTTPTREGQNRISTFDPSEPNTGAGNHLGALSIYGVGPGRDGLTQIGNYYFRAFAPKIGFAYMVTPKTVFRSSFGISYYPYWDKWIWVLGSFLPSDGFSVTRTASSLNSGITPAFNWQNGFPLTFPQLPIVDPTLDNGGSIGYFNPRENRPPMVENIGAEIERELPGHVKARVGYVGVMAHRVYASYNFNTLPLKYLSYGSLLNDDISSPAAVAAGIPIPYAGFTGTVAQALIPYPQYPSGVGYIDDQMANTSYNSLQINIQRHFGDLTFLAAMTFAKYLTMSDNPGFGSGEAGLKAQDFQIPQTAKSLGGYYTWYTGQSGDIAKQLNLSWYWNLPFGHGKHFVNHASKPLDYLVGNWRFSALQYYQGGEPAQVWSFASVPFVGGVWANLNKGVPIKALANCGAVHPGIPGQQNYLNVNAFSDPAPFNLGNTSILPSVRTCGYIDEDLGVEKGVPLGAESRRLAFGAMFTDLFNRHQFQYLSPFNDSSAFGTYANANFPRTVQVYARITF